VTCALAFAEPHRGPSRLTRQEVELQTPGASKQIKHLKRDTLQHQICANWQTEKWKNSKLSTRNFQNVETITH
jgi:hypothetical protein